MAVEPFRNVALEEDGRLFAEPLILSQSKALMISHFGLFLSLLLLIYFLLIKTFKNGSVVKWNHRLQMLDLQLISLSLFIVKLIFRLILMRICFQLL